MNKYESFEGNNMFYQLYNSEGKICGTQWAATGREKEFTCLNLENTELKDHY